MGNGGSASTAEHFETDLSYVRMSHFRKIIQAKAITSNSSLITAIANDIGFENVFSHQLKRNASAGDVCFLISASGNSENLLNVAEFAKENKLIAVGLLGFDGGKLSTRLTEAVIIKTKLGEFGTVEDAHLQICHYIALELKKRLFGELA